MPNISASDYTSFIKAQAASLAYQGNSFPTGIQTSAQPYINKSVLNAQLLASQAAYYSTPPKVITDINTTTVSSASVTTVTDGASAILSSAVANIVTAAVGSTTYITYTTGTLSHGLVAGDIVTITGLVGYATANVVSKTIASAPTATTFTITIATDTTSISTQTGQINIGPAAAATVYYTSSVPHGLSVGTSLSITGFATLNATSKTVTKVIDSTHFAVANIGTGAAETGPGTITGLGYYVTSVAHGLSVGNVITITNMTNFNATNLTVANVASTTRFALSGVTPNATADTGKTGTIVGLVYYTTAGTLSPLLYPGGTNVTVTVSGITTNTSFNLTGPIFAVPSSTAFVLSSLAASGTAVTGKSGTITRTQSFNPAVSILGNARVRPFVGVGYVNQPKNLSTVSRSGTLSSGKTQQPGGLPLTAAKWDGVYSPVPHLARVDTRATGAYNAVRQPV